VRFLPNSALIDYGYSIQDPDAIRLFAMLTQNTPNSVLCQNFIFGACSGNPAANPPIPSFLAHTNFTSVQQCVDYMDFLETVPSPCPFPQQSNTKQCRQLHATASFALPHIHCSHTRPNNSIPCSDGCLATCSNCHADAKCVAIFDIPNSFAPTYMCQCKNGYTGNGLSCTALTCSQNGQCPSQIGSYTCGTGNRCTCKDTFEHNPTSPYNHGYCTCPDGTNQFMNGSVPVCVPNGRCLSDDKRHMCHNQHPNKVKCKSFGSNTMRTFLGCLCNYGFEGGWEYPCVCPPTKSTKHSNLYNGEVCLASNECTDDSHCASSSTCNVPFGQPAGTCSSGR